MSLPIGLQLFSIKDETAKDFAGTLKKVAEIGYEGVEFAGYGGLKSHELKAVMQDLNLKACGSHVGLNELVNDLAAVIDYNLEIGNPYIICPWSELNNIKECEELALKLNTIGEKCKKEGLILGYHNHNHEFKQINSKYLLDILYEETKSEYVKAEIDTYWVEYSGVNAIEYMKKYTGRVELVHMKDMEIVNGEKRSTEIGNGIIDIKAIAAEAENIGVKWLIVEQEYFRGSTIESVKLGYENLKKLIRGER
ncbi:sugar phosphate isomerase/epimerase family protein [Clostridium oryzae]|uniref:Inosose dehydratase n=1 Tax=Clostridium oryzae TaxID=1450648 RepID=A0A1V4ITM0_9CLOT|nr:sugar phosphate isomerase/epimerase [Clostridium oryzae]OPJ63249.1 inosose dehydratase [Clostridium oryzae]